MAKATDGSFRLTVHVIMAWKTWHGAEAETQLILFQLHTAVGVGGEG